MAIILGTAASEALTDTTADLFSVLNANWSGGNDTMTGGSNNDTYNVNSAGDVVVEAAAGGVDKVVSRLASYTLGSNVENLVLDNAGPLVAVTGTGNGLDNEITGNDLNNTLNGGGGNDILNGGLGADTLNGGAGNDDLIGEEGADTLNGDAGSDILDGGNGADTLNGGADNDLLQGGNGADTLNGDLGNDRLDGGDGADTLNGGAGIDRLHGGNGADTLNGGDGNDSLNGGANDDTLFGNAGNDQLNGGSGNDVLAGSAGNDGLTGGAGADRFVFAFRGVANADAIKDFSSTDDSIVLANLLDSGLPGAVSPGVIGLSFVGGNVAGNPLAAANFFVGPNADLASCNALNASSGIYVDTDTGEIRYNPTSNVANDCVIIGTVQVAAAGSLTAGDFLYGN
ncbi:hypothetical protein OOT46_22380 [Aquabacterium sp. A7-Y]|uniref:calcium-binding protein n=1 Tax=Aquabacterium sp. A7-Y TaxID=1349605 RepID=UPI00223DEA24|nr:calcium-binding protein [Aquabacterium sp. A7-Y]MCW7540575.1 hypothetical protein [Aquabacterium sp. A7-Y]